jgi:DNA polymerase III delta prime subunit
MRAAYIIDLIFLLVAPTHPALIALALLQYVMRRWDIFCRGIISLCGIRVVTSWMLILLPGLANEQHELVAETQLTAIVLTPNTSNLLSTGQWLAALDENPHLLIYGPSKAGKSTLAQAIVSMFGNCEYVVIDPMPNKPAERKWGGIDFITLDLDGDDEYASIKAALVAIDEEDNRRRRTMREITHRPLIVIVDEVLALVGVLGDVTNEHGKKEPRMSHFIRRKGYSARHRNIKIILIGQGKNLIDLGLNSSTARNNYAQIRVFRNPATNERAAYIVSDDGEYALDISQVPQLAASATHRARVWLTQDEIASEQLMPVSQVSEATKSVSALESRETAFRVSFSEHETAKIAAMIARNEKQTPIIRAMPGYRADQHAAFVAKYVELKTLVERQ